VKTTPKSSVKRAASKAAPKSVAKAAPKVAAKVAPKLQPAAKSAVKSAVKSAKKPPAPVKAKPATAKAKLLNDKGKSKAQPSAQVKKAEKAPAHVPLKSKPVIPSARKPVPAKAKPAATSGVSAAVKKPAVKTAAKSTAKTPATSATRVSKEVLKPAQAIAKAPIATSPIKVKIPATAANKVAATASAAALVEPAPVVAGDVPARATRPSARLAQITVPSMAQSVASTAAKASYLQNTPTQVMTPVFTASIKKDAKLANNWKTKKVQDLSDPEILAMSDDHYMNDAQMAYFKRKLVILKNEILASAGQTTENLREDTVVVPDPADRATIEEEHALELRTRDRERKLLKKIEQSITRIEVGDYGYCDETGEPIGIGRLLARPTATLSLEAQQRRELKQKMFGD
jgi:DnaK suppressor protein